MNILDREIHLWLAYDHQIQDTELLGRYFAILDKEEQLQQKRFQFEKHRHQYLITRAMVRCVLSLYDNVIKPDEWRFEKTMYGKPFIRNTKMKIPLQFNLSHSEGIILLAITNGQEVGVDVECLLRHSPAQAIAKNLFSPVEIAQLTALPKKYQRNRFFELWTLKEAYIKACGMGLSIPLNQFTFSFSEFGTATISFDPQRNDQPALWHFWRIELNDTHKVALGLKNTGIHKCYSLSFRRIVPMQEVSAVEYPYFSHN
jgi:4'-phosphopantetheinyl transferase